MSFAHQDPPHEFRAILCAGPGRNHTGLEIRTRGTYLTEDGWDIPLTWETFADGESETLDTATADTWLTEAGYRRTSEWSAPRPATSGRTFYRADIAPATA
ncbi:hypothetical protein [Nocardia sp. CC201C]|uniref:hypothetical protein n=1 Tax=Nocardia sp. CC201C TaxID=3044575 RepID=UPI0024A91D2D|nr:hypothetical protein [Nocardia sp. CC201C]